MIFGIAMTGTILFAAFLGSGASNASVPSPSDYTSPSTPSGLSTADYAIIGIIVALFLAGILYYALFLRGGKKGGEAEGNEESSSNDQDEDDSDDDDNDEDLD